MFWNRPPTEGFLVRSSVSKNDSKYSFFGSKTWIYAGTVYLRKQKLLGKGASRCVDYACIGNVD